MDDDGADAVLVAGAFRPGSPPNEEQGTALGSGMAPNWFANRFSSLSVLAIDSSSSSVRRSTCRRFGGGQAGGGNDYGEKHDFFATQSRKACSQRSLPAARCTLE